MDKFNPFLMEAISKQQAVFKQFGAVGYGGSDNVNFDDPEGQKHQKLEKLIISTLAAKHFQRDILRGVEGYIGTGSKQVEIGTKLSKDSRKYGAENTCTSGNTLSKAALSYGEARSQMEKECGKLLKALGTQVAEPLSAMLMGGPLENARHLAQRYDSMRQEAEAQAIEVSKWQAKVRESMGNHDLTSKLEAAEMKLHELKSNVATSRKEASVAMASVEAKQQRLTLQRLITMVASERSYHSRILLILDQLESEMVSERQRIEAPTSPVAGHTTPPSPSYDEVNGVSASAYGGVTDTRRHFLRKIWQPADSISEEVRSDQQTASIFSGDLRLSEKPADILCRDLRSDEQPAKIKIISEDLRSDTRSSGPSDSITAETERAKWKVTESSLCLEPNSGTTRISTSLMVPEHMDEKELVNSASEKALSLIPSLELQQRLEKNEAKSEPSGSGVLAPSNPSVNSKGEVSLKPEIHVVEEPKCIIGVAPTGSMIGSASSSESRWSQKRKSDQVEGQKSNRKCPKFQEDRERIKMPMVSCNESLSSPEPTTYDELNKLPSKKLNNLRVKHRLRGPEGKTSEERRKALILKILEKQQVPS